MITSVYTKENERFIIQETKYDYFVVFWFQDDELVKFGDSNVILRQDLDENIEFVHSLLENGFTAHYVD